MLHTYRWCGMLGVFVLRDLSMPPSNPIDWTSVLVQVPIVAVFIWFTLRLNAEHQKTIDKIVADNRQSSTAVMADWRNYLKERDEQWINFLIEQRNSQNKTLDTFAQRLNDVATVVRDLDVHARTNLGANDK